MGFPSLSEIPSQLAGTGLPQACLLRLAEIQAGLTGAIQGSSAHAEDAEKPF